MIDLRLRYATPDEVLRWYVLEHARRSGAKGIDLEKPLVDGGGGGDSLERYTQLVILVRGVPELAIEATRVSTVMIAGYTGEPKSEDYPTREDYLVARDTWVGPAAVRPNEVQVARALGVAVSAVRGALSEARGIIRPRLLAMVMEG